MSAFLLGLLALTALLLAIALAREARSRLATRGE
jgi:hypothetical protein